MGVARAKRDGSNVKPAAFRAALGVLTQAEIDALIASAVTTLIGTAGVALDTLGELSDALGDDANFASTVTNALAGKAAGAASSTDNALPRFDGTTGKTLQDSGITVDDSNNATLPSGSLIQWAGRGRISSPADGRWMLEKSDGTDVALIGDVSTLSGIWLGAAAVASPSTANYVLLRQVGVGVFANAPTGETYAVRVANATIGLFSASGLGVTGVFSATGAATFSSTVRVGVFTVATLPTPGTAGRKAQASNGRKSGEGAGVGTGVPVWDDGTNWKTYYDNTTVAA